MAEGTVPPVSRKRRGDFVGDVQRWSEQSWYTRMWSPSPAGGPQRICHPHQISDGYEPVTDYPHDRPSDDNRHGAERAPQRFRRIDQGSGVPLNSPDGGVYRILLRESFPCPSRVRDPVALLKENDSRPEAHLELSATASPDTYD